MVNGMVGPKPEGQLKGWMVCIRDNAEKVRTYIRAACLCENCFTDRGDIQERVQEFFDAVSGTIRAARDECESLVTYIDKLEHCDWAYEEAETRGLADADGVDNPMQTAINSLSEAELAGLWEGLSPVARVVYDLALMHHPAALNIETTAEVLGMSEDNVRHHIIAIERRMSELLAVKNAKVA